MSFFLRVFSLKNSDLSLLSSVKAWNRNPELYYIVQVQVNSVKGELPWSNSGLTLM